MYNDGVNHLYAWRNQRRDGDWTSILTLKKPFAILLWLCRCIADSQVTTCGSHDYCFENSRGWQYSATASCNYKWAIDQWSVMHTDAPSTSAASVKIQIPNWSLQGTCCGPFISARWQGQSNNIHDISDGPTLHLIGMTKLLVCKRVCSSSGRNVSES